MTTIKRDRKKAADIVRDAGGKLIGRTRLQKVAYFLELAGLGDGFQFEYRHYGPYSEALSEAVRTACVFDLITEDERPTNWGGYYSVYEMGPEGTGQQPDCHRAEFVQAAANISSIELELAATAAYLYIAEDQADPWQETARRKPEKATPERLASARQAYQKLSAINVPKPLPQIAQ